MIIEKKYKVKSKVNNNNKDEENNDRVKDYVSESRGRKLYE